MSSHSRVSRLQQQRVHQQAHNRDTYDFFNVLTGEGLLDTVEELLPAHRERVFPPTETLSMYLAQVLSADRSCQHAVNQAAIQRLRGGLPMCSTYTGGYCRARHRLPQEMVSRLALRSAQLIEDQVPQQWCWQGRRVCLIDGATVSMADTAHNQAVYPQSRGQKPGLGFAICRMVGVISLSSGALLNANIGPTKGKGSDEQSLLRELLETFNSGDVVLGDGFFGTYFLLASLLERGVDAVFEQMGGRKRVTDFRTGRKLGARDHLVKLTKPKRKPAWMTPHDYEQAPPSITIRECRAGHKILITTLLCPKQTPKSALKALFKHRWDVELDLRNIKTTLGMETLRCRTPQMCEKEIWVYFLAYNLIRLLMAQSASLADVLPRQLSFKHTVQLWVCWRVCVNTPLAGEVREPLFVLIAQRRVGNRPGRIEPRAVKRRPKPLPLLTVPREQARAHIAKHGHPRKIK